MSKGLASPFGSPPGRPGKYVFYLTRVGDDDTQIYVSIFGAAYSARKFLDVLLDEDEVEWSTCGSPTCPGDICTLTSSSGIRVSTIWERWPDCKDRSADRLRRAYDHEYTPLEMAWDLPPHVRREALVFRNGPAMPRTLEEAGVDPERRRQQRSSSAPRVGAPAGYVHVSDLALQLAIDAKQTRVALRKIFPDGKPSYGWYFDPATLDDLKAKIKAVVK